MKVIYDAVKWTAIWTWSESFRLLSGLKGAGNNLSVRN